MWPEMAQVFENDHPGLMLRGEGFDLYGKDPPSVHPGSGNTYRRKPETKPCRYTHDHTGGFASMTLRVRPFVVGGCAAHLLKARRGVRVLFGREAILIEPE
jgi:hypothetical protein